MILVVSRIVTKLLLLGIYTVAILLTCTLFAVRHCYPFKLLLIVFIAFDPSRYDSKLKYGECCELSKCVCVYSYTVR